MKNSNDKKNLEPGTKIAFLRGSMTYEADILSRTTDGGIVFYEVDVLSSGGRVACGQLTIQDQQIIRFSA